MKYNLILLCLTLVILCAVGEITAVYYYKPNDPEYFLQKNSEFFNKVTYREMPDEWMKEHYTFERIERNSNNAFLGRELIPYSEGYIGGAAVKINSDGIRDREYSVLKPSNTFRIAVLGDSFTFGDGVSINDTYPKILEDKLNSNSGGIRYEVINFGVYGYNIGEIEEWYESKVKGYNPDMVLYGYFPNDPEHVYDERCNLTRNEINMFIRSRRPYLYYFFKLHIKRLTESVMHGRYTAYHIGLHSDDYIGWLCTKRKLDKMGSSENPPFVLFVIPIASESNYQILNETIYSKIKEINGSNGNYLYFDLPGFFEAERQKYNLSQLFGETHYSRICYEIIADCLYRFLRNH